MLFKFLAQPLLGLTRGWWLLIVVGGLLIYGVNAWINRTIDVAKDAGATEQREANLTETVKNVEKSNAAAETVVRDPVARNAECLRNARNPANC